MKLTLENILKGKQRIKLKPRFKCNYAESHYISINMD